MVEVAAERGLVVGVADWDVACAVVGNDGRGEIHKPSTVRWVGDLLAHGGKPGQLRDGAVGGKVGSVLVLHMFWVLPRTHVLGAASKRRPHVLTES